MKTRLPLTTSSSSTLGSRTLPRDAGRIANTFSLLLAVAALAGCASVKVVPGGGTAAGTLLRPPTAILVQPFSTDHGMWQGGVQEPSERIRVRDWLAAELESELRSIAPTSLHTGGDLPTEGWLVSGRFVRVNPGSKAQRMFLGLGVGASKLETRVAVYDLAVSTSQPILELDTTGGSNLEAGPTALVTNAALNDIARTAREIRGALEERIWAETPSTPPVGDDTLAPVQIGSPAAGRR
ncbi:hypothetical protein ASA1KI_29720 [Opitutales bacterium ASA1]|uniref:DUF4410 domain-containing protein n=1 Tax=Congregicoccus parvus TaxID=3081749 RepID=UPI002B3042C6|nr:hypothetical protein ASA1KI_29720 [Opitutales bacterium ASA1]